MHKYRVLLLLPFVVSHFLFYFSLHYPSDGGSCYYKNAPVQYSISNPSIEALQIAKVKQVPKNASATSNPSASHLCNASYQVKEPVRIAVVHRFMLSRTATADNAATLFPTRASPA
jgi:hypothetical protein